MRRVVTQDETRVHHFDSKAKQQGMQWKHTGSSTPKKLKRDSSAVKVMTLPFWDSQGVIIVIILKVPR